MQREDAGTATITVDAPGFHGSLEELVARANRGDVDLNDAVGERRRRRSPQRARGPRSGSGDLRAVADTLSLLARLVALKAAAVLPDQNIDVVDPEEDESTDAGRRLAEYRLFKAAAEALLAEAATEGARSFLGLVSSEVIPVEHLRIAPGAPGCSLPRGPRAPRRRRPIAGRGHVLGGGQGDAASRRLSPVAPSISRRSSRA